MAPVIKSLYSLSKEFEYDHGKILNAVDSGILLDILDDIRYKTISLMNMNTLLFKHVGVPILTREEMKKTYNFDKHENRNFVVESEMIDYVFEEYVYLCQLDEYISKKYDGLLLTEISSEDIFPVLEAIILFNINISTLDIKVFISNNYNTISAEMFDKILNNIDRLINSKYVNEHESKYKGLSKRYKTAYKEWVTSLVNILEHRLKRVNYLDKA